MFGHFFKCEFMPFGKKYSVLLFFSIKNVMSKLICLLRIIELKKTKAYDFKIVKFKFKVLIISVLIRFEIQCPTIKLTCFFNL